MAIQFKNIPQERVVLYLLLLGLLPLCFVGYSYNSKRDLQTSLNEGLDSACLIVTSRNQKELHNRISRHIFQNKEKMYLTKEIESITPLHEEAESLQKFSSCGFHPEDEAIRKRIQFLTSNENKLVFTEGQEKRFGGFSETLCSLAHPIEVNLSDLKKIISRIEGVTVAPEKPSESRPQLIISEFRLDKKRAILNDVFVLHLKVIKREYSK